MQTAEMLKPTISSMEEEVVDHFPHLLLVHNRAQMEDFTPKKFRVLQKVENTNFCHAIETLLSFLDLQIGV